MVPEHLHFGGGATETAIHPLVAAYLFIAIALILVLPRSKVVVPFLLAFFTIPIGQVVVLGALHFTALRILILAGLVRQVSSGGSKGRFPGGFNGVDKVVLLWSALAAVNWCLIWMTTEAVINQLGGLVDTVVAYLVVRYLIPDSEAVRRTIKVLAMICMINGISMIIEQVTNINLFGLLGGIPVDVTVREGHIRSAGVMGCLYAGAFAGVLIPLFTWLWTERKSRMIATIGIAGVTAMMIASYSSTSYLAYGGGLVGLCCWPLRQKMRFIRRGLVVILVGLHLVMKAPVWALIARIDLTGSSSGYQRYMLVDMTIRHFSDWWLIGTNKYVAWGWDSWDLCNQFVAVALTGGLLALIFYIAIFKLSFGSIGTTRKQVDGHRDLEWPLWCLGSALFATLVAHFGINYVPQLLMGFFPLVVCIGVMSRETSRVAIELPVQSQERLAFVSGGGEIYVPLNTAKQVAQPAVGKRKQDRAMSWQKVRTF